MGRTPRTGPVPSHLPEVPVQHSWAVTPLLPGRADPLPPSPPVEKPSRAVCRALSQMWIHPCLCPALVGFPRGKQPPLLPSGGGSRVTGSPKVTRRRPLCPSEIGPGWGGGRDQFGLLPTDLPAPGVGSWVRGLLPPSDHSTAAVGCCWPPRLPGWCSLLGGVQLGLWQTWTGQRAEPGQTPSSRPSWCLPGDAEWPWPAQQGLGCGVGPTGERWQTEAPSVVLGRGPGCPCLSTALSNVLIFGVCCLMYGVSSQCPAREGACGLSDSTGQSLRSLPGAGKDLWVPLWFHPPACLGSSLCPGLGCARTVFSGMEVSGRWPCTG